MGDGKVEKSEMHDFARKVGADMRDQANQIASLGLAFDCLVTMLQEREPIDSAQIPPVTWHDLVKAEMQRRIDVAKKAAEEQAAANLKAQANGPQSP